jgi:putative ABC transport system permease protein
MPDWMTDIRARLAAARLDPAREAEIAQELAQHLDDRYAELLRDGIAPDDARAQALDELKDQATMREQLARIERQETTVPPAGAPPRNRLLAGLWQDVRFALRSLRVNPGFAALALTTLALGIAATTVVYAVIDNVLLRPVGYRDADRLGRVAVLNPEHPGRRTAASFDTFEAWRTRNRTLEAIAIYNNASLTLLGDEPVRVAAAVVTPLFFEVNGVRMALGRGFTDADGEPGAEPVLILSDGAWQRRFGADPGILGRRIPTTAGPRTVVGVLPDARFFWGTSEFWLALGRPTGAASQVGQYPVLARLKAGVTFEQAEADLASIVGAIHEEQGGSGATPGAGIMPLREMTVGHLRTTLYTLLGAVGCILLIACMNVAGLLVARGAARERELNVRVALGASRWRIARQLLTESVLLAMAGGLCGGLLAWWLVGALIPLLPVSVPSVTPVAVDARVLAIALAASVLSGLAFGLAPAIGLSRATAPGRLRETHQVTSRWGQRTGKVLVFVEVALCLVLLGGAGLMVRTMIALYSVDPGFEPRGVVALGVTPVLPSDASPARAVGYFDELLARVRAMPGVQSASLIDSPPFGLSIAYSLAVPEGSESKVHLSPRSIATDYFQTMGIPVVAGRDFTPADSDGAAPVAIVSAAAAQALWPGQSPLGRVVRVPGPGGPGEPLEVVGVVGDVRHLGLDESENDRRSPPAVYHPYAQRAGADLTVVARSASPASVTALILAAANSRELPERALTSTPTDFEAMIARTTADRRSRTTLLAVVAALGLLLSAVGIFGLTAYTVSQRTREIGIRVALGAQSRSVLRTVMGGLALPIGIGIVAGVFGAWGASRWVESFLFGVQRTDPITFATAALFLAAAAFLACYVPARRALRVDPVIALRAE